MRLKVDTRSRLFVESGVDQRGAHGDEAHAKEGDVK